MRISPVSIVPAKDLRIAALRRGLQKAARADVIVSVTDMAITIAALAYRLGSW